MTHAHYSTAAVAAPKRFDYWKEMVLRHCIPAASNPLQDGAFDAQLRVRDFGELSICDLSAPAHHWERTPQHLRTGPDDDFWIGFNRSGYVQLQQGERSASIAAEQLFLYDASQTFRFSLGGHQQLIRIPRRLLSARLPNIGAFAALALDEHRPGVIPLREMLRQAADAPSELLNAEVAGRFSQTLLDLLVLSLECHDPQKATVERDLYGRALDYIQCHLADQDLTLERIARAHHVSVRTVTRAFARYQQTPAAVIWQQRLIASREALARGQVRSVSEAALEFGFSDFSHFSHAFKKAFGQPPQEFLRVRQPRALSDA